MYFMLVFFFYSEVIIYSEESVADVSKFMYPLLSGNILQYNISDNINMSTIQEFIHILPELHTLVSVFINIALFVCMNSYFRECIDSYHHQKSPHTQLFHYHWISACFQAYLA